MINLEFAPGIWLLETVSGSVDDSLITSLIKYVYVHAIVIYV